MREWFQSQLDWHIERFQRPPEKYYFMELEPTDQPGYVKINVLSLNDDDVDELSSEWTFVADDHPYTTLPKLTRKRDQ